MNQDFAILIHPIFGMLGLLCAIWVFVETLNANEKNMKRIRLASFGVAGFIVLAWIFGGYWYVTFYGHEKALILKGPWPLAHSLFMEVKEHLFFVTLLLAIYLPVVSVRNSVANNALARKLILNVSGLIIVTTLMIEGAGAVISNGVKVSLLHPVVQGENK